MDMWDQMIAGCEEKLAIYKRQRDMFERGSLTMRQNGRETPREELVAEADSMIRMFTTHIEWLHKARRS